MIIFLSKFPCSGVPYSKGKLLEKVAWNQEPEPSWGSTVVLSGTVCRQFRPLWIVYSHSFHLFSLGGFS